MADPEQYLQPCPSCATLIDVSDEEPFAQVHCPICGTSMRVRRQFNNYQIEEVLGAGGMGSVYRAMDLNLQRPVALKLLRKEYSADAEYIGKFETEARITASINHPHVVKVFSYGSDHGLVYIAMELVDKGSLDDLINLQTRVPEAQVLQVGIQAAEGLQAAHEKGLIHRDVKPGNILFANAHTAKIVDFGLALLMAQEAEARGEVWGTPYYVAPEKLNKEPEDFRSDIYSLGGTLFHALAGRPPFEAETASLVALKHIKSQAVSLQAFAPHVSSSTAYVINRMLHKNPDERYQSYGELIEHLTYARTKLMESTQKTGQARQKVVVTGGSEEKGMAVMVMAMLLILVLAGGGVFLFRDKIFSRDEDAAPGPETSAVSEEARGQYDEARDLFFAGDYASASERFDALAKGGELQPPFFQWALFHRGLSLLLDNRPKDAREAFAALKSEANFSTEEKHGEEVSFFQNVATTVGERTAVPGNLRGYDVTKLEALSYLVFALADWHLGEFEDAGALMRKFVAAKLDKDHQWIVRYQEIGKPYLADIESFLEIKKAQEKATTPDQKKALVEKIREVRGNLKIGGKASEELLKILGRLQSKLSEMSEAEEKLLAERATSELRSVSLFEGKIEQRTQAFDVEGLKAEVERIRPQSAAAAGHHANLLKKAGWLAQFKAQLLKDLNSAGFAGPIHRQNGMPIPGAVLRANETTLFVGSKYGAAEVRWTEVARPDILTMGEHFAAKDPNRGAERRWLLGVFAISLGMAREGRKIIVEAAQSNAALTDDLSIFFESSQGE